MCRKEAFILRTSGILAEVDVSGAKTMDLPGTGIMSNGPIMAATVDHSVFAEEWSFNNGDKLNRIALFTNDGSVAEDAFTAGLLVIFLGKTP